MKAVFLDRDGIINVERGDYTYKIQDFQIIPNIINTLVWLRDKNFFLIVVTNQSGISLGRYQTQHMHQCHEFFQKESGDLIDAFYYAPLHPSVSKSLSRKPDSLMLERAISRYKLDPLKCWMVGDKERDLVPARNLRMKTILLGSESDYADYHIGGVSEITKIINNSIT